MAKQTTITAAPTVPTIALTASEIAAHLTDSQRKQVFTDAARATAAGKPLRTYKAGFTAADVLRTFRGDQSMSEELSLILNVGHDLKIGEAAQIIALRNGFSLQPAPVSEEQILKMEAARIARNRITH